MILRFIRMNILTITVTIRRIIISYNVNIGLIIVERSIGHTAAAIPSTNSMLNILEPTTLPTARSFSPFFDATMDVTSSGSDVPKATIVSPISVSVIPSERAISVALSTTKSPPSAIAVSPAIMKKRHFGTDILLPVSESSFSSSSFLFFSVLLTRIARYEINKITINGESYEITDRNEIIMPYFKEVKEDKEIIVSFVKKIENPKTLDNIMSYIGYAVLSIIGLVISGIVLIKNKTQEKI